MPREDTSTSLSNYSNDDNLEPSPSDGTRLQFPISDSSTVGNWMYFARKKYQKFGITETGSLVDAENSKAIALPVPQQLSKNYNAEWNMEDLGIWGNAYQGQATEVANKIMANKQSGKGYMSSMVDGWNEAKLMSKEDNAKAWLTDFFSGSDTGRSIGSKMGWARNPFKSLYYSSPNFRQFSFQWKLVPKNLQEANTIRDLIKEFQIGMAPSYSDTLTNNLFLYPDLFTIAFSKESYLFKFAPCVLTQCTIDYHGESSEKYIANGDDKIPFSIVLQLTFQEAAILSRQEFEEGY